MMDVATSCGAGIRSHEFSDPIFWLIPDARIYSRGNPMRTIALMALAVPIVSVAQTPVITFEKTHHDFGKIGADRKVSYRYKVTNTGQATLNITNLKPACGCTSTVLGKWSLAPGESSEIEASFDPKGFRGPMRRTIAVVSDDPSNSTVTLSFEANIIQEIVPSATTVFFNDLSRTATKKATVRLASGNELPVQVKDVRIPGAPYLSTRVRNEGNDAVLDIEMDGSKVLPGKQRGMDSITVITGSSRMPVLSINAQWELKAFVVSTPERVAWVDSAGKELRSLITLKQIDGKPFRIIHAKSSTPLIRIDGFGRAGAPQQDLQVILSATAKPGTYNERVILALDDPDQSEMTIRVSAVLR